MVAKTKRSAADEIPPDSPFGDRAAPSAVDTMTARTYGVSPIGHSNASATPAGDKEPR